MFLKYALRRCCAERRPFVLYREGIRYLFVKEGVFKEPADFLSSQYCGFIWTLVDADDAKDGVPEKLVPNNTGHFVIYCTPPVHSRWSRVHKTVREYVIVMDPWTRKEILQAYDSCVTALLLFIAYMLFRWLVHH
jgi:hypothetical protein